jgi:uncharacterized protein YegP (UPF0339 family)
MAKFIITNDKNGQFIFVLKANNGKVILCGESYTSKRACLLGIQSVKQHSAYYGYYEKHFSETEQFFFVLTAANKKTIGKSQLYNSPSARSAGITAVRKVARDAEVIQVRKEHLIIER